MRSTTRSAAALAVVALAGVQPLPAAPLDAGQAGRPRPASAAMRTIALIPAGAMFPGTAYQNQHQLSGASGAIQITPPTSAVMPVILRMTMTGLLPNKAYVVFLDRDGTTPGGDHSFGPWLQIGQFASSPVGRGELQYQPNAGSVPGGSHTWAVFVSRADVGSTVLISENFSFNQP